MIITSVEKYKGTTYAVAFGDEKIFLHRDIVADFGLRSGADIDSERYAEIIKASERRRATERALYLLDYRDHSYVELFKKLRENYDEETCYYVTDKLAGLGMINDRRYAENLARKYIEVKKFGFYRASREMYQKGLDRELVDEVLSAYSEGTVERICEIIEKKYSGILDDRDKVRKMKNALVRQGYSYDDINAAVKMMDCESDDEY